jgi:putative ABC transport system ATP-binding protein
MSLVHLKDVKKGFDHPSGRIEVIKGLNLEIEAGQTLAILGPSGSGKSTLLSILSGLESVDDGQVSMAGHDLVQLNEKGRSHFRATSLGIVFQQFHLIGHLSALENVQLSLDISKSSSSKDRASEALRRVGLEDRFNHLPSELSGGESQRVAIARAMVHRPPILLADEPSGNLDGTTGDKVMGDLFREVRELGSTLILVTHNEGLAQECQRLVRMEGGRLVEAKT